MVIGQNTTENDLYEGFAKDLIEHISIRCKFKYEISVKDIESGKEDPITGQWSGIVGDIVNKVSFLCVEIIDQKFNGIFSCQKADLAIGDITITHSRKTAIDFSTPFMTLGISILYAKPHKEKAGLFSFMDPLSMHVWLHMATAFLCISITEFLLAK